MRPYLHFVFWMGCLTATGQAGGGPLPLQQWINEAIQAGGGTVTIPEGQHILPHPLVIENAKKVAIRGVNKERCILKLARGEGSAAGPLITVSGTGETLEISGLTLAGSGGASPLLRIDGTHAAMKDITVRDCLFEEFTQAVQALSVSAFSLEGCSFRDGHRAVILHDTPAARVRGNFIARSQTSVECLRSEGCLFEGNEWWDCDVGILILKNASAEKPPVIRRNGFTRTRIGLSLPEGHPSPVLENNENLVKGAR